ncbi:MAG: cobalamin-binding protein, partial [Gammaproteobacteria bacterium]|nr:cobalamin-binding protein [Gammaproteobacteria bacterium]
MSAIKSKTWLAVMLLWSITFPAAASIEVIDDSGARVQLEQPAQRIVSLAPSLTEMLFAVGAGDKVVGVVEYSDFPPAATSLPIVGRHDLLNLEAILALQPDLVVSWRTGNPAAAVERLQQLGLTVYVAEPSELHSIPGHLAKLALLTGAGEEAQTVVNELTAALNKLRETYSAKSGVRVFYQVWDSPLITAGGNELINDMITLCGGQNIFADLSLIAPKVSTESVLVRNPQVIIASGMDIARPEWLDSWENWPQLEAVSAGHLYFIPP